MKVVGRVLVAAREAEESVRRAGGRQGETVEVGRQKGRNRAAERTDRTDEGRRSASQHRGTIERERLRTEVSRAGRVEHVHAHVVRVRPDGELGVIEVVRPKVETITIVGAGRVTRSGNGNTLVRDRRPSSRAGELADHPAIGQLIIKHDGITKAAGFAGAAEAAPKRDDTVRAEDGVTGGFVENLVTFVDHLHVLRQADGAVGIGRSAAATDTGEGDAVKVKDRRGNAGREEVKNRTLFDNRVGAIDVRVRDLRILSRLPFLLPDRVIRGGHLAQGTRDVVVIGGGDLHPLWPEAQGGRD